MLAQEFSPASQAGEDRASSAHAAAVNPITHRKTAQRTERLLALVAALQTSHMMREDIGELLQVGPSGVRKYIKDLGAAIEVDRYVDGTGKFIGFPVYRLAMTPEQAQAYLTGLAAAPEARRTRASASALSIAAKDPSRHFHILADDTHYAVRVSRSPVARDPLVAALFGPRGGMEMRA